MLKNLTTYILLLITFTFILGDFYSVVPSLWHTEQEKNIFSVFLIISLLTLLYCHLTNKTQFNDDYIKDSLDNKKE
jgi:hypothetical protein